MPGASGSKAPLPVSRARRVFISASVRAKSKRSILPLIRPSLVDFGRVTTPSCSSKRKMICPVFLPSFSANCTM